jgi:hypothetical protein
MITSVERIAMQSELRKRMLISSVLSESTTLPVSLEVNEEALEHPFLGVTKDETVALFELVDGLPAIQYRRVYAMSDYEFVRGIFSKAKRVLSNPIPAHEPCEDCWDASPAIAVRHCFDSPIPTTGVLYQFRGCGEAESLLLQLEGALAFLRSNLVDAFVVWVPRYTEEEEASIR